MKQDELPKLAISIRQPWAWLIVNGWKDIENRTWWTSVRGRIGIHAAKGMTRQEYAWCLEFITEIEAAYGPIEGLVVPAFEKLERGGLVGEVELVGCVRTAPSPWFMGPHGLQMSHAKAYPQMIPCKGMLGFFQPKVEGANP